MASGGAAKKQAVGPHLRVYSNSDQDEIGIQTLVGEYMEKGTNHSRKYYQKVNKIPGHDDINVMLYYWDKRDGPDFCGWWFGDSVGSSQVWSRANAHGQTPPMQGWRVPWDGPVTNDLLIVEPIGSDAGNDGRPLPSVATRKPTMTAEELELRVQVTYGRVQELEAESEQVIADASEAWMSGDKDAIADVENQLRLQLQGVQQAQKDLAKEISEARTLGPAASHQITALSKFSPILRGVQANVTSEIGRAKALLSKASLDEEEDRRRVGSQMAEQRDAKLLQEILPAAMDLVSQAEDAVETVAIMAAPFSVDDELGESEKQTINYIEESAQKASTALMEARKVVSQRMSEAKRYAVDARKVAVQEFTALQAKLTEAGKKLNPLKKFRQEFEQRLAIKKAVEEIAAKLGNAELEVEKAHIMTTSSSSSENLLSEDEIKSTESLLGPAQAGIQETYQLVERRMRTLGADDVLKEELDSMQNRAKQAKEKLDEVRGLLRKQREGLSAQRMLSQAHERVEKAEESLMATQEAEMPFLKGVEVLPPDEAMQAVVDSEAAADKSEAALESARSFIKSRLVDAKTRYSKQLGTDTVDELCQLQTRTEVALKKLKDFKRDTTQRKTQSLLQEVVEKVKDAESQVQTLAEVSKLFASDNLDEVSTESLKSTREQTVVADKDASTACAEARKHLVAKQRETKEPQMVMELSNLQGRLNKISNELTKLKKAAMTGDKMIKSKQVLLEEEDKVKQAEDEVTKAEALATPLGDEKPSDEAIAKIDEAVGSSQDKLNQAVKSIERQGPLAIPVLKAALSKLLTRAKKAQEKIDSVKSSTREQRERVSGTNFINQAQKKTEAVEEALEKVQEAELPFLKGIEVLPLKEAAASIADSEAAAEAVQKTLGEVRTYIAARTLEVRRFAEPASKSTCAEFAKMTERVNQAAQKLSQFRKDTEGRKRNAFMQEATEKVSSVETEVQKTTEAAAPLIKEDLDKLSAEAATEVCEKLAALEKAAKSKMEEARSFLHQKEKDIKGHAAHEEQFKTLTSRLNTIQVELAKQKTAASEREQRFVAKKLLTEATDIISEAEGDIEKAAEGAKPLTAEGGNSFLAANNVILIVEVLAGKMHKGEATKETLFKQANGGAGNGSASQNAFKAFLEKMPELFDRKDLTFSPDQRDAIFKHFDADKNGEISCSEFEEMLRERFTCVHGIAMTDTFDISTSKTVTKVELNDVVEALGAPQMNESLRVTRLECKLVESGKTGWVTMRGNQGTTYLEPLSLYSTFTKNLDRQLDGAVKNISKANNFIKQKGTELASCAQGPLADARGELAKLKPRVVSAQKKIDDFKKNLADAKKDYSKREETEKKERCALAAQSAKDS